MQWLGFDTAQRWISGTRAHELPAHVVLGSGQRAVRAAEQSIHRRFYLIVAVLTIEGLEATVTMPSIDCVFKLAEVYEKVPGPENVS
jgi:hypothetical protein